MAPGRKSKDKSGKKMPKVAKAKAVAKETVSKLVATVKENPSATVSYANVAKGVIAKETTKVIALAEEDITAKTFGATDLSVEELKISAAPKDEVDAKDLDLKKAAVDEVTVKKEKELELTAVDVVAETKTTEKPAAMTLKSKEKEEVNAQQEKVREGARKMLELVDKVELKPAPRQTLSAVAKKNRTLLQEEIRMLPNFETMTPSELYATLKVDMKMFEMELDPLIMDDKDLGLLRDMMVCEITTEENVVAATVALGSETTALKAATIAPLKVQEVAKKRATIMNREVLATESASTEEDDNVISVDLWAYSMRHALFLRDLSSVGLKLSDLEVIDTQESYFSHVGVDDEDDDEESTYNYEEAQEEEVGSLENKEDTESVDEEENSTTPSTSNVNTETEVSEQKSNQTATNIAEEIQAEESESYTEENDALEMEIQSFDEASKDDDETSVDEVEEITRTPVKVPLSASRSQMRSASRGRVFSPIPSVPFALTIMMCLITLSTAANTDLFSDITCYISDDIHAALNEIAEKVSMDQFGVMNGEIYRALFAEVVHKAGVSQEVAAVVIFLSIMVKNKDRILRALKSNTKLMALTSVAEASRFIETSTTNFVEKDLAKMPIVKIPESFAPLSMLYYATYNTEINITKLMNTQWIGHMFLSEFLQDLHEMLMRFFWTQIVSSTTNKGTSRNAIHSVATFYTKIYDNTKTDRYPVQTWSSQVMKAQILDLGALVKIVNRIRVTKSKTVMAVSDTNLLAPRTDWRLFHPKYSTTADSNSFAVSSKTGDYNKTDGVWKEGMTGGLLDDWIVSLNGKSILQAPESTKITVDSVASAYKNAPVV